MKNRDNSSFNLDAWDEFSHSSVTDHSSGEQTFDNFRHFRDQFNNLSKRELIERGWLESINDTSSLAQLFFALSSDRQNVLYRKSASANVSLMDMWVALVRTRAEYISIAHQVPKFQSLTKADLKSFARSSVEVDSIQDLPAILAKHGIILVYFRGLKGMKVDGVVFQLSSGHMVIGMSFRFSRLDYFWFTLMHELAHLVLHGSILNQPIMIDVENESNDINEKAANKLAKESFVNKISWRTCEPKYQSGDDAVRRYARQEGVHASIIAGLLRKESGNYTRYNTIINQYNVTDVIFGK